MTLALSNGVRGKYEQIDIAMHNNTSYRDDLKFAYEQSINAYQHHVQRYSTWMNMYAIITGALLVAFYSLYSTCECDICPNNLLFFKNYKTLLVCLIAVLGWISSLCWYGCVKGHYEWMKSFMSIVKHNEKIYFKKYGETIPYVYSKVRIRENSCEVRDDYILGFWSTQKITLVFIKVVVLAWPISLFGIEQVLAIVLSIITIALYVYWLAIQRIKLKARIKLIVKFLSKPLRYFHSTIHPDEIDYYL